MKLVKLFVILAVLAMTFSACEKDDPLTPTTGDDSYLPSNTGNYWIYKCVPTGTDGKEKTTEIYHDSVFVVGFDLNGTVKNYNYKNFVDYKKELNTPSLNKDYSMSYSNNKITAGIGFILPGDEDILGLLNLYFPTGVPTTAILADFANTTQWTIMDQVAVEKAMDFTIGGITISIESLKYGITGKKGTAKKISIGSKTVDAEEFIITHNILVNGKYSSFSLKDQSITIPIKLYFAKNYGLVAKYVSPVTLNISLGIGNPLEVPMAAGENQHLINYKVN